MKNPKIKKRHKWQGTEIFSVIVLTIIAILIVVPFWNAVVISLETSAAFSRKPFSWLPGEFTLANYDYLLFQNSGAMITAYKATIGITVVGTFLGMLVSVMGAYAFSRKFPGKKFFFMAMLFTMFFGGGLIPWFLVMKQVGLYNNVWAMVLPTALNTWNMIILRTGFQSFPYDLEEAAVIDGASQSKILMNVILPLSKPVLAVIFLYYLVGNWNSWFNAMVLLKDRAKYPLQLLLKEILVMNDVSMSSVGSAGGVSVNSVQGATAYRELVKYCVTVIVTLPILCVYPFLQKYFVKGVFVGSIKG